MKHRDNECSSPKNSISEDTIEKVTVACKEILSNNKDFQLAEEYDYGHLVLCVIDSVFSIGVRYQSVKNTINHFCAYYRIEKFPKDKEVTNSQILEKMEKSTLEILTEKVFQNKQRTSTKNGILKSDAVLRFLKVLVDFKVDTFKDLDKILTNDDFEIEIRKIPGQNSGISLKYFFMLAGSEDLIKPDRMIIRFLEKISDKKLNLRDCQFVLTEVTKKLNSSGFKITPKKLDNLIWSIQRS
jgi:hypothetical protein